MFRCLTEEDTRRPVALREVAEVARVSTTAVEKVTKAFRRPDRCFLRPYGDEPLQAGAILDISHESLIWQWNRLEQWTKQEAESGKNYQHLQDTAYLWENHEHDLLGRLALKKYWDWWIQEQPNMAWAKRYGNDFDLVEEFLNASKRRELPEIPGGALELDSHLYTEREVEEEVFSAVKQHRAFVTLSGPAQSGKTSFIMRVCNNLQNQLQVVFIDFQIFFPENFRSLDNIWRTITYRMVEQLHITTWDLSDWSSDIGYDENLFDFLEILFKKNDAPLLLCFDGVERVFTTPIESAFFASLRSFYDAGAREAAWSKTRWLLATSSESAFFIDDLPQTPFNAGIKWVLSSFSPLELYKFARRYGFILDRDESTEILEYVGGHPYLVHLLMYHLFPEPYPSKEELFNAETAGSGIFRDYLHRYLIKFQEEPELARAMMSIIHGDQYHNVKIISRLEAAGLICQNREQKMVPFCRLYAEFFKKNITLK
jgi:hypothetical protein